MIYFTQMYRRLCEENYARVRNFRKSLFASSGSVSALAGFPESVVASSLKPRFAGLVSLALFSGLRVGKSLEWVIHIYYDSAERH
jgi:hypothetical protein